MAESQSELPSQLEKIYDLLALVGFVDAGGESDVSASSKLAGGINWCISAVNASAATSDDDITGVNEIEAGKGIEEALKLTGCPHTLQASQIEKLDYESILPVVQWFVKHVQTMEGDRRDKIPCTEHSIKEEEYTLRQLEVELDNRRTSIKMLNANMDEQNQRKVNLLNELQHLQQKISKDGADASVQRMLSLMELLKALERQISDFQSKSNARHSQLQAEISELEEKIASGYDSKSFLDDLDNSLKESMEKLNLAKRERAARLREIVSVKRQIDDVASQSELIQYERCFSELYVQIQGKHRQTRKYYSTYNALLEIKEMMLKETSLLNSIMSQFQDAITSADGRMKLIDSMDGIVKGSQQKLEKVQLVLQEEQKVSDNLKERYVAAVAERRHCDSLLKAFQEECAKNERLRSHSSN